jgi:hypothetical protein
VRRVLEHCGGSIELESRDTGEHPHDHGTVARMHLRRAPPEGPEQPEAAP